MEELHSFFEVSAAILSGKTVTFMRDGQSGDVINLQITPDKVIVSILSDQDGFIRTREYGHLANVGREYHIKQVIETLNASRDI